MKRCRLHGLVLVIVAALSESALADDKCVEVREQRESARIALVARLENCIEATITVTADLENMTSTVPFPLTEDSRGRTRFTLAVLVAKDATVPWRYTWRYDWKLGRRLEGKPGRYIYALPYRDTPRLVLQGAHGRFSHGPDTQDEEAIDWRMPAGTKVYAARRGTVVAVRADATEGGTDAKWKRDYNYVVIEHEDGTFAEYSHLEPNGVLVGVGEKVSSDRAIGLSGNTGFSTEPHLHFAVFNTIDGKTRETRPVEFRGANGEVFSPREGTVY
jgi:murein DD-endopeptidase MepM/ murein hydrolase activator NlpD